MLKKNWVLVILSFAIIEACFLLILQDKFFSLSRNSTKKIVASIKDSIPAVLGDFQESADLSTDISSWKTYQNLGYQFKIKYPTDWPDPKEIKPSSRYNLGYEYEVSFRNNPGNKKLKTKGFDIFILKNKDLSQGLSKTYGQTSCSMEEVSIFKEDFFYNKGYYYHITGDSYAYDIFPIQEGKNDSSYDEKASAKNNFPEFRLSVDTFSIAEAEKETPKKTELPKTLSSKRINPVPRPAPRISCPEKNDHPSYSDTKGSHVDEDCCPDPDEWPKPGCIYSPEGYAIMKKGAPKKK